MNDRLYFRRFVGLGMEDAAPDSTTVYRFRNTLVEADLYDAVLGEINRQLEEKGVIVKRGAIVDASITDTPRRPSGRREYEVVEDRHEEDSRKPLKRQYSGKLSNPMWTGKPDGARRWKSSTLATSVIR